jgi:hypothetical protein
MQFGNKPRGYLNRDCLIGSLKVLGIESLTEIHSVLVGTIREWGTKAQTYLATPRLDLVLFALNQAPLKSPVSPRARRD